MYREQPGLETGNMGSRFTREFLQGHSEARLPLFTEPFLDGFRAALFVDGEETDLEDRQQYLRVRLLVGVVLETFIITLD
jgi:hypothetical protein